MTLIPLVLTKPTREIGEKVVLQLVLTISTIDIGKLVVFPLEFIKQNR